MTELADIVAYLGGRETWMEDARCKGMDTSIFFPERGTSSREARKVCAGCPVRVECSNYQKRTGSLHGVWGGRMVSQKTTPSIPKEAGDPSSLTTTSPASELESNAAPEPERVVAPDLRVLPRSMESGVPTQDAVAVG